MSRLNAKEKRRVWRALFARQAGVCFYCPKVLVQPPSGVTRIELREKEWATIDHLRPLSDGGSNRIENMVLACVDCHQERHRAA
jgi:5-methylcytosine-specific restriction endonuclease McrA